MVDSRTVNFGDRPHRVSARCRHRRWRDLRGLARRGAPGVIDTLNRGPEQKTDYPQNDDAGALLHKPSLRSRRIILLFGANDRRHISPFMAPLWLHEAPRDFNAFQGNLQFGTGTVQFPYGFVPRWIASDNSRPG